MTEKGMKPGDLSFKGKRVLVVGGAGFVGSNLVKAILDQDPQRILIIDNLLSSEQFNIPDSPHVEFIKGSITDDGMLLGIKDDLDYVFHLATFHGNQNSIYDPLADHENNTLTTLKLFERIKQFQQIKKVVYSSAGCTVAEKTFSEAHATTEEDPVSLWLDSPYQISKIIGEFYSNYYFSRFKLPVVKARFQNVYGPGEILGAGEWRGTIATVWRNVIPTFIYRAIKQMPLVVENEGKATRDFIYVSDIVNGLMLCALKGVTGEVYNLASGIESSILDLAKMINQLSHNLTPIEIGPRREWDHSGKRYGYTEKAEMSLGFKAVTGLQNGLQITLAWTLENLHTIEATIQKHVNAHPEIAPAIDPKIRLSEKP